MISSTFASFLSSEFYSSSLCFSSASSSSYPSLLSHLCFLFCLSFSSSSCLNHRFFSFPFSWRFHNLLIDFSEILIKTEQDPERDQDPDRSPHSSPDLGLDGLLGQALSGVFYHSSNWTCIHSDMYLQPTLCPPPLFRPLDPLMLS